MIIKINLLYQDGKDEIQSLEEAIKKAKMTKEAEEKSLAELVKNYDTFIVKIIQVYYNDVYDILCYVKYEMYLLAKKYFIVL